MLVGKCKQSKGVMNSNSRTPICRGKNLVLYISFYFIFAKKERKACPYIAVTRTVMARATLHSINQNETYKVYTQEYVEIHDPIPAILFLYAYIPTDLPIFWGQIQLKIGPAIL
jgi:hypothetical protein